MGFTPCFWATPRCPTWPVASAPAHSPQETSVYGCGSTTASTVSSNWFPTHRWVRSPTPWWRRVSRTARCSWATSASGLNRLQSPWMSRDGSTPPASAWEASLRWKCRARPMCSSGTQATPPPHPSTRQAWVGEASQT